MRYSSFFNLPEGVNYKLYDEDILEFDFYKLLESIDVVIHLAAITDATNSFHIKIKSNQLTIWVLKACRSMYCSKRKVNFSIYHECIWPTIKKW